VLLRDDGDIKQVGRSCIKDFLGHKNPHHLAEAAELVYEFMREGELAEEREYGGRGEDIHWVDSILPLAAAIVRVHGFLGATAARQKMEADGWCPPTTAERIHYIMRPLSSTSDGYREWKEECEKCAVTPDDEAMVVAIKEWLAAVATQESHSEYEHNLLVACHYAKSFTNRRMGLVVSVIQAYRKHMDMVRQRSEVKRVSKHVGEVGKRMDLVLTVKRITPSEGTFGTKYITRMEDDDGNVFVWFASSNHGLKEGTKYNVRATVKSHDTYKDVAQTVLLRCDCSTI
jgi:hypothetical protein